MTKLSGLPKVAKEVTTELQAILVDLIHLSLEAKQVHWNVHGPLFRPLHGMFDEMAESYRGWYDEVAERNRALGAPVDGRLSTVANTSKVEGLPAGEIQDRVAITMYLTQVEGVAKRIRDKLGWLGELDPVTQDMVINIVEGLEKQAWMLRVQQS